MISGVQKSVGSLKVLDGIDFKAHAGELVSLVGLNGAGETTLMRCIADGTVRTAGTIVVNGLAFSTLKENEKAFAGQIEERFRGSRPATVQAFGAR